MSTYIFFLYVRHFTYKQLNIILLILHWHTKEHKLNLETASQVLAGSWLECQHLTVDLLKNAERNSDNEILFQRVWEQRLYLDNIAKLLSEFKNDAELAKIKKGYEGLLAIYKEPKDSKDINKEFLNRLSKSLGDVRAGIIKIILSG